MFGVVKGLLLERSPVSREIFPGEVNEGAGNSEVVRDELLIEVGKT